MSKKILICEDNQMNFFVLQNLMYKVCSGIEITHAVDGKVGLDLFLTDIFDAVITDISMPELDGWQLIEKLVNMGYPVNRIMVVSAETLPNLLKEAQKYGVKHCFTKPFMVEHAAEMCSFINGLE
ncbi:MAG: response regulator [Bacteroidota bacterium]|jgi:CheY-like chemotaxis protein